MSGLIQRLRRTFPCRSQPREAGREVTQPTAAPETDRRPELTEAEEEALFFNPKLKRQKKPKSTELPEVNLDR